MGFWISPGLSAFLLICGFADNYSPRAYSQSTTTPESSPQEMAQRAFISTSSATNSTTAPGQPTILAYVPEDGTQMQAAMLAESKAWYVLSQIDTKYLLFGLPERLSAAMTPLRRGSPVWRGILKGGQLELDLRMDGEAKGQITVGFFSDPRWWIAEPVQVRQFPGPGHYTVEKLPPARYYLGAMIGGPPKPTAFGVNAGWPAGVEIKAGETTSAHLLVSTRFRVFDFPNTAEGFASQWAKMAPSRMITVRTVDSQGEPVPFCRVTLVDRGEDKARAFHNIGTDEKGYAYSDALNSTFSVESQRFDFLPNSMAGRYYYKRMNRLYDVRDRPNIIVTWDSIPEGSGKAVGCVHDQNKRPLTRYYLTLTRTVGQRLGWDDFAEFAISIPVIDKEGKFEVTGLPPGTYQIMVRHFDYPTHVSTFQGSEFKMPDEPNAVVPLDVEVEAKELLYGVAVYEDGSPVGKGGWTARFTIEPNSPWGGESFSLGTEADGSFRVSLSREEHAKVIANSEGMVEIWADGPSRTQKRVPLDKLSKDPRQPLKVIFPKAKP